MFSPIEVVVGGLNHKIIPVLVLHVLLDVNP
jgi:hypothetical protein